MPPKKRLVKKSRSTSTTPASPGGSKRLAGAGSGTAPAATKHPDGSLRGFPIPDTDANVTVWRAELQDMMRVLTGKDAPPIDSGVMTLMEVSDAFHARAGEMMMDIYDLERQGLCGKGDPLYQFRTGELRTFMDVAKRAADLGSRRLTEEQLNFERSRLGRGSAGTDYE